jgi:hypothetical protein
MYFFCDEINLINDNLILIGNYSGYAYGYCCSYKYPMLIDFSSDDILNYVNTQDEILIDKNEIQLYPNPSRGTLKVAFKSYITGSIEITDILGRIYEKYNFQNRQIIVLDISTLIHGVYFIKTINSIKNKVYII